MMIGFSDPPGTSILPGMQADAMPFPIELFGMGNGVINGFRLLSRTIVFSKMSGGMQAAIGFCSLASGIVSVISVISFSDEFLIFI